MILHIHMQDYTIIGGGIAGLYANYLLQNQKKEGLLLEKNQTVFGRVREHDFHGTKIKCAAGIGVPENKTLVKLLKKLKMPVKVLDTENKDLRTPPFDMGKAIRTVKKEYKKMTKKDLLTLTSREILYKYFGTEFAEQFIRHSEFEDYLEGSFEYLMKYYPIGDLETGEYKMIPIDWTMMVERLSKPNIRTEYLVTKIEKKGKFFIINDEIETKEVIFAVTISTFDNIQTVGFKLPKLSDYVGSVPFSRVYAYYKNGYEMKDGYVLVNGVIDKIIKINKNVLMASYADSDKTLFWKNVKPLPDAERCKIVQEKLADDGYDFGKPDEIFMAVWSDGVHYIKPYGKYKQIDKLLDKLSKPCKGITIIGEMLSKKVGYVEGALQSVERALK